MGGLLRAGEGNSIMTKRELAVRISAETGLTQQQVADILQRTLDYITESLAAVGRSINWIVTPATRSLISAGSTRISALASRSDDLQSRVTRRWYSWLHPVSRTGSRTIGRTAVTVHRVFARVTL